MLPSKLHATLPAAAVVVEVVAMLNRLWSCASVSVSPPSAPDLPVRAKLAVCVSETSRSLKLIVPVRSAGADVSPNASSPIAAPNVLPAVVITGVSLVPVMVSVAVELAVAP